MYTATPPSFFGTVDMLPFLEKRLNELLEEGAHPLSSPARHAVLVPGKRFRPLLVLATAQVFWANPLDALDPACAIEMIHTYSLIHDDLPCMDDDDLRRGKPTLHKVYPEGIALLTGDFLLTYAFEILSKTSCLPPEIRLYLIQTLSSAVGAFGMIGGQAIDLNSVGRMLTQKELELMHQKKTAALIVASIHCGAHIGGASKTQKAQLQELGEMIGLAYQFQDDLLNAVATQEEIGKPVGSDAAKAKPTAVSVFGKDLVLEQLTKQLQAIDALLNLLPQGAVALRDLLENVFAPAKARLIVL